MIYEIKNKIKKLKKKQEKWKIKIKGMFKKKKLY